MARTFLILTLLLVALALATACGRGAAPTPTATAAPSPPPTATATVGAVAPSPVPAATATPTPSSVQVWPVTVAVPPLGMEAAALFLAQEGGYFEAEGAKATLQRVAAPEEALRALQQGQVSAALVTLEQLLGSVGSARPVVAIGLVNGSIPFNVVLRTDVAQARGLDTTASLWERYQALKGLRIGVPPGKVAQAIAEEVLYVARLDPISDVRLVPVAEGDTITALTSGRVDALLARHPYAERAIVEQNAFLLLHLSRGDLPSLEPFPWLLLVTTSERLNSERDALFGLVRGLFQAQQAMRRNAIFASRALAPAFPDLPEPVYQKGVQLYFPAVPGTPLVTPEAFSRALRSLGREPLPFASVVDNRLVADALGR